MSVGSGYVAVTGENAGAALETGGPKGETRLDVGGAPTGLVVP